MFFLQSRHLFLFLLSLRTLARSFPCIILVTMPSLVFEGPLRDRLEPLFDLVVGFHSLACRPSKYSDFDAVLKIDRLARINSLKSFRPPSLEYLLKVCTYLPVTCPRNRTHIFNNHIIYSNR